MNNDFQKQMQNIKHKNIQMYTLKTYIKTKTHTNMAAAVFQSLANGWVNFHMERGNVFLRGGNDPSGERGAPGLN